MHIIKQLGLVGLYKGATACFCRDVPFVSRLCASMLRTMLIVVYDLLHRVSRLISNSFVLLTLPSYAHMKVSSVSSRFGQR